MGEDNYWKTIAENDRNAFTKKITKLRKENVQLKKKLEEIEHEIDHSDMCLAVYNITKIIKD